MAAIHDQLRTAADLISQPLLLEVLVGTEAGSTPRAAVPPGADPEVLRAAVQRLTAIGAVHPTPAGDNWDEPLTLTARGEELLRLLRELESDTPV